MLRVKYFRKINDNILIILDPLFVNLLTICSPSLPAVVAAVCPGAVCTISPTLTWLDTFTCSFEFYSQNVITATFDFQSIYGDNYTTYIWQEGNACKLFFSYYSNLDLFRKS